MDIQGHMQVELRDIDKLECGDQILIIVFNGIYNFK